MGMQQFPSTAVLLLGCVLLDFNVHTKQNNNKKKSVHTPMYCMEVFTADTLYHNHTAQHHKQLLSLLHILCVYIIIFVTSLRACLPACVVRGGKLLKRRSCGRHSNFILLLTLSCPCKRSLNFLKGSNEMIMGPPKPVFLQFWL